MENKNRITIVLFAVLLFLSGCGEKSEKTDPEKLLDAFLASEIPAIYNTGKEVMFDQLPQNDKELWINYSVGERIDLDNDGENEQIIYGPYGGLYLDARDQKVYVFEQGDGTALMLSYTNYDNAVWVVHSDTIHGGRQIFSLTRYDGGEKIVEKLLLAAEYWDSPDGVYDKNSDFTFRGEKISMEKYEALRKELFGW